MRRLLKKWLGIAKLEQDVKDLDLATLKLTKCVLTLTKDSKGWNEFIHNTVIQPHGVPDSLYFSDRLLAFMADKYGATYKDVPHGKFELKMQKSEDN